MKYIEITEQTSDKCHLLALIEIEQQAENTDDKEGIGLKLICKEECKEEIKMSCETGNSTECIIY